MSVGSRVMGWAEKACQHDHEVAGPGSPPANFITSIPAMVEVSLIMMDLM